MSPKQVRAILIRQVIQRMMIAPFWIAVSDGAVLADDWPQWRGPNRTNVSLETGLSPRWPEAGPPLAWEANGLGDGVVPVSVADGRVYCTGYRGDDEFCSALSETDGAPIWSVRLGPSVKELMNMRWLNQRTPTVDGDRVYVVTVLGDYICLETATGKEVWRRNAIRDYNSTKPIFGFCDYPLVDHDKLIISPGGSAITMAALDKRTGELIWQCSAKTANGPAHSALMATEIGGVRQYINAFMEGLIGVRAADGALLWDLPQYGRIAVTHSPIAHGDTIFFASGYGAGHKLIEISPDGERFTATEIYTGLLPYAPWLGSLTQVGDHIFCNPMTGLACLERSTGQIAWSAEVDRNTYTVANGRLYVFSQNGMMSLVAADAKEYRLLSEFKPFAQLASGSGVSFPVVANGRLYIRDLDTLRSYDVRDRRPPENRLPDAVFVPTPEDVVPHLLELASIKSSDLVYDLGSGDGRLVIAATKTYGCQAVGIEIDQDLVALARKAALQSGVDGKTRFEHRDLFEANFSKATVVTLYILPEMLQRLIPQFRELQPGSRIVSHEFAIPGMKPFEVIEVKSEEDGAARKLYLYTTPLEAEGSPGGAPARESDAE